MADTRARQGSALRASARMCGVVANAFHVTGQALSHWRFMRISPAFIGAASTKRNRAQQRMGAGHRCGGTASRHEWSPRHDRGVECPALYAHKPHRTVHAITAARGSCTGMPATPTPLLRIASTSPARNRQCIARFMRINTTRPGASSHHRSVAHHQRSASHDHERADSLRPILRTRTRTERLQVSSCACSVRRTPSTIATHPFMRINRSSERPTRSR